MNKKIIALILTFLTVLSLVCFSSCGKNNSKKETETTVPQTTAVDVGYANEEKLYAVFNDNFSPYSYGIGMEGSEEKFGTAGFSVDIVSLISKSLNKKMSVNNYDDNKLGDVFEIKNCDIYVTNVNSSKRDVFKDYFTFSDTNYPEVIYIFRSKKVLNDFKKTYDSLSVNGDIDKIAKDNGISDK